MDRTLRTALDAALQYLDGLDSRPVAPTASLDLLRARIGTDLSDESIAPDQVLRDMVAAVDGGIMGSASGRFFGWVIGGALPAAVGADWLSSVWDHNAALHSTGPAAAVVEEVAGRWLKQILRLPEQASFAFVSGCQMANVTCLAAARHALLARHGWNVETDGLWGAPRIRVLATDHRHGALDRALRLLGFGCASVTCFGDAPALERELQAATPAIVLLQAGEINTGSFDPFEELIPIARRYGAWVHVEGAFGLWAAASPRRRHLLRGAEAADSWATDGHKWLNTPFDCGYAFIADETAHRAALSYRAGYLTHSSDARDQIDWNPEWSRRARGFPTYAALRQLGRKGIEDLIERSCRHAHTLATEIGRMDGAELLSAPILNQALVRFLDPLGQDHDGRTDAVIAAVNRSGEAFFTGTSWRGMRAMRISVCNWRTSEEDVSRSLACIRKVLECQDMSES
jgi:glutamate/tyrosine decarboxylase-like PLP-dependent enzyme